MPRTVTATDYHTAGEPLPLPGVSVADRRVQAAGSPAAQGLRELLCFEPRGHADMYGGFLVPPDDDGACLGVLFWHKDGFSTACGPGTIALGAWAVDTGLVPAPQDGSADVVVDFVNVPSYVLARDIPLSTSRGQVAVTVAYGGAIYASLDAATAGLRVDASHYRELTALGREVKWALNDSEHAVHPVVGPSSPAPSWPPPPRPAARPSSRRSPAWPTGPGSTPSLWTPPTRWCPGSCSAERSVRPWRSGTYAPAHPDHETCRLARCS